MATRYRHYGSLCISGKLPSYPSPKPTLTFIQKFIVLQQGYHHARRHLGHNVGLGEGKVGSFPATYNDLKLFGKGYVIALSLESVVPGFLSQCIPVTYTKTSLRSRDLKRFGCTQ